MTSAFWDFSMLFTSFRGTRAPAVMTAGAGTHGTGVPARAGAPPAPVLCDCRRSRATSAVECFVGRR